MAHLTMKNGTGAENEEDISSPSFSEEEENFIPSDNEIRTAVREILPTVNIEEVTIKKFIRLLSRNLGVSVDDMQPKKALIKKALAEEIKKKKKQHDSDDESLPDEEEIVDAAKKLTKKVDMETTTFKKFMKLLADELDVEDLSPAKPLVKKIYESAEKEEKEDVPSDVKIVKAAKKLALSNRVDLDDISETKFLRMLQKRMGGVDLSTKKELVADTLQECKDKRELSKIPKTINRDDTMETSMMSKSESMSSRAEEVMMMPVFSNNVSPVEKKDKPRTSEDLEQGRAIPQAAGLTWTDDFFDNDQDELVAVFDHNHPQLLWYHMRVVLLQRVMPIAITWLVFIIIIALWQARIKRELEDPYSVCDYSYSYSTSNCILGLYNVFEALRKTKIVFIVFEVVWLIVAIIGWYRIIRSTVYGYHLAVERDGVRTVHDNHIWTRFAVLAAFPCFDSCLLISKKSETVPFDQITKISLKSPGEINRACCCWWACACCLKIPYFTVELDTGSSNPSYAAAAMDGLTEPEKFQKLAWAMKREKGEQIHKDMRSMMMFDQVVKYGRSPGMQQQQQVYPASMPPGMMTAPTTPTSVTSSSYSSSPHQQQHMMNMTQSAPPSAGSFPPPPPMTR